MCVSLCISVTTVVAFKCIHYTFTSSRFLFAQLADNTAGSGGQSSARSTRHGERFPSRQLIHCVNLTETFDTVTCVSEVEAKGRTFSFHLRL